MPFASKIDITKETNVGYKYRIHKPKLETDVTKKLASTYLLDGNLRPARIDSADLTLKGELIDFRRDPLSYTDADDVEEYRINIVVNITLWDNIDDKLVWEENGFTGDSTYFTTGSRATSESSAIIEAIADLARRIVERTVEEW